MKVNKLTLNLFFSIPVLISDLSWTGTFSCAKFYEGFMIYIKEVGDEKQNSSSLEFLSVKAET